MIRDLVFRYDLDQLRQLSFNDLEQQLTDQLAAEIRLSPDGLAMRYPVALYKLLASHLPARYTLVNIMGATDMSTLLHLRERESVTLWLIEAMANRHLAFENALGLKLIHVNVKDNSHLIRVEICWDSGQVALHDAL